MHYSPHQLVYFAHKLTLRAATDSMDRMAGTLLDYVTTQSLNAGQLKGLSEEVAPQRTLLVCCGAFRGDAGRYPNLTVKKIPKMVLKKCEWKQDSDYSLSVENLPQAPKATQSTAPQPGLFDGDGDSGVAG